MIKGIFNIIKNRELIASLVRREIVGKYRGSFLGILWSFLNPLFFLIVYTLVFSKILRVRFGSVEDSSVYGLYLFSGMVPWLAFSEAVGRSPGIIHANVNLIKKTIFPTEILPLVSTLSAFIHSLFGIAILIIGIILIGNHVIYMTIFLLPMIIIPQILFTLGLSWFLSSIGVFIRDALEVTRIILTAWMFLTPIVYPLETIPEKFRILMLFNPMATIVEGYRDILLRGQFPEWGPFAGVTFIGALFAVLGYAWFMKTKKTFADVV